MRPVGQQVWVASFEASPSFVTCPDCGGSGRIRCWLHDDTMVSVGCEGCQVGYDPPTGRIRVYDRAPRAKLETIVGFEVEGEKVEYRTDGSYRIPEGEIFDSEAAAMDAARAKAAAFDREERERISAKEKPTKTWAWHVTYHRRAIKEAERQIEYHTRKLNAARVNAKEPVNG